MAYKTGNDIIKEAFDKIGLFPDGGNLGGNKPQKGLDLLNAQLEQYESEAQLIAYDSILTFNLVPGQRIYTISPDSSLNPDIVNNKIVKLKYINLLSNDVQYLVNIVDDFIWYRNHQNLDLTNRPWQVFLQNDPQKSILNFFSKPDQVYECQIKGKFTLSNLDFSTDISTLPKYYILFLIYELARLLADFYPGTDWSQLSESIYTRYKSNLLSSNDTDFNVTTSNVLNYQE